MGDAAFWCGQVRNVYPVRPPSTWLQGLGCLANKSAAWLDPAAEATAVQVAGLVLSKESAVLTLAPFWAGKGLQVTISKCVVAFQVQVKGLQVTR